MQPVRCNGKASKRCRPVKGLQLLEGHVATHVVAALTVENGLIKRCPTTPCCPFTIPLCITKFVLYTTTAKSLHRAPCTQATGSMYFCRYDQALPNCWRDSLASGLSLQSSAWSTSMNVATWSGALACAFLVVRDGHESLAIHREVGDYPIQILASYPGKRYPLGIGSSGMALLAALPEDEANHIVELNAHRLEEYGGMTPNILHRLRKNAQTRGYAVMQNYAVRGAMGVGCALTDSQGNPILALSVSAITERMPLKRQGEIPKLLQQELDALRADL